jgi:hypothetical protein
VGVGTSYLAQPPLGSICVLENLEFKGNTRGYRQPQSKYVVVLVGLHDVGDLVQTQPLGLWYPNIHEPISALKPRPTQPRVVVEQDSTRARPSVLEVGFGPRNASAEST